jgi:hypothetical protein
VADAEMKHEDGGMENKQQRQANDCDEELKEVETDIKRDNGQNNE